MTKAFPFVVPVLLSAALSCAAQSPRASIPKIIGTIYDIDSGQPLSNTPLKVQLFPPEHGGRKFQSLLCTPSDNAQPLSSSVVTTDSNGSFNLTAQGGDYLAKMTIPKHQPVFGCIFFDTEASLRVCGVDPSSLRTHQQLFVRVTHSISGFGGDILSNSACAAYQPSLCNPLHAPNLVHTEKVVLIDSQDRPVPNAQLEFSEYTKRKGLVVTSVITDAVGTADLSGLRTQAGLLRMSVASEKLNGEFLVQFTMGETAGQQIIKIFQWHCKSSVMQAAIVQ